VTTAGRGIRNAFRSATRTVSIILILGLAIGLAVVMLTAHRSVSDKIAAEKIYCRKHHCTVAAAYYNRLADELARTVISDKLVVEKNGTRTWPFKGRKGQARPTVDGRRQGDPERTVRQPGERLASRLQAGQLRWHVPVVPDLQGHLRARHLLLQPQSQGLGADDVRVGQRGIHRQAAALRFSVGFPRMPTSR